MSSGTREKNGRGKTVNQETSLRNRPWLIGSLQGLASRAALHCSRGACAMRCVYAEACFPIHFPSGSRVVCHGGLCPILQRHLHPFSNLCRAIISIGSDAMASTSKSAPALGLREGDRLLVRSIPYPSSRCGMGALCARRPISPFSRRDLRLAPRVPAVLCLPPPHPLFTCAICCTLRSLSSPLALRTVFVNDVVEFRHPNPQRYETLGALRTLRLRRSRWALARSLPPPSLAFVRPRCFFLSRFFLFSPSSCPHLTPSLFPLAAPPSFFLFF